MENHTPQNSNIYCTYMCEHVQKITEALYRITDLFPDKEPLKWYLRKEGISIFKIFLKFQNSPLYERIKYFDRIEIDIPHMIQALELSSLGTFISRTNFEVLSREYNALLDFIKNKREELLPESVKNLSVMSFEERLLQEKTNATIHNDESQNKSFVHNHVDMYGKEKAEDNGHASIENKNGTEDKIVYQEINSHTFPQGIGQHGTDLETPFIPAVLSQGIREGVGIKLPGSAVEPQFLSKDAYADQVQSKEEENKIHLSLEHANDRHKKILSIIGERGEVSVSDVSSFFGGISEKTIQRDLVHLANQGTVKKYGDKRWRRYVLNENTF